MAVFFFSSRRRHTRCLSDWSSDVCSSDLLPQRVRFRLEQRRFRAHLDRFVLRPDLQRDVDSEPAFDLHNDWLEIGRASCRERVEISGGAGTVKKKIRELTEAGYT